MLSSSVCHVPLLLTPVLIQLHGLLIQADKVSTLVSLPT